MHTPARHLLDRKLLNKWILFLPTGLLAVAAALKAHTLLKSPAADLLIWGSYAITVVAVCVELLLAAWLLSRIESHKARRVCLVAFVVFSAVSLLKGLQGESNCACFGAIETSPWLSLVLDLLAIACLATYCPESNKRSWDRLALIAVGLGVTACVAFVSFISLVGPVNLDSSDTGAQYGAVTVIDPADWLGKKFPLQRWIVSGADLQEGHWTVIIYYSDCKVCHSLIEMYVESEEKRPLAFVEVSSLAANVRQNSPTERWLRLDESRDWFVEAPLLLELQDGVVTSVQTRNDLKAVIAEGRLPQ